MKRRRGESGSSGGGGGALSPYEPKEICHPTLSFRTIA